MDLIVGATGNLGRAVTRLLLAQSKPVRILARPHSDYRPLVDAGAEVALGDLTDPAALRRACAGIDRVFDAAHSLLGRGKLQSVLVDGTGQRHLIDAARAAGVGRFVFMSVRGASATHPVDFCRTKYAVEQYLRESGLAFSIVRPTSYYIPHVTLIGDGLLKRGKATIFGRGNNPRNFVAIADVAHLAVRVLSDPQAHNQVIEIGGPDNLTNNQVAELYARTAGIEPRLAHVPRAVLRIMAALMKPVQPGLSSVMRWALYSDSADETFDPTPMLQKYPMTQTRLADWICARVQEVRAGNTRQAVSAAR